MMQHQQHLFVRNATRVAADWAASPAGRLLRVEVLVTLSCALLAMLVFLGSGRRYSRSAAFRAVVWSVLMLSYPVVSYTIGLMQSTSFRNDLMVVWACFLLGCADGIAACSVDDSDQQARLLLNQAAQTIYVLLLLLAYAGSLLLELKILLFLFWVLTVAKLGLRLQRLVSAGRNRVLTIDNGLVTSYMADEYRLSGWRPQRWYTTVDMDNYKYVVTGEENLQDDLGEYRLTNRNGSDIDWSDEENIIAMADRFLEKNSIVTLDRVCKWYSTYSSPWKKHGNSESYQELLNLCISFALFKLLRRRLSGSPHYELHEMVVHKVRTLFSHLVNASRSGHEIFRIIEVELGFLFDFIYSRYPSHKQTLIPETIFFTTAVALSMSSLFSSALMHYNDSVIIATRFDIWLTRLVISLFLILESFQYLSLVLSDWHRVKLFCCYVIQEHSWLKNRIFTSLVLRMCSLKMTRRYWSNTVGQYSLLHASIQPEISCFSCLWMPKWMRSFLIWTSMTTHHDLPDSVKDAIVDELRNSLGKIILYKGRINTYDVVYYPGNFELEASSWGRIEIPKPNIGNILIWHIATTICGSRKIPLQGAADVVRGKRLKAQETASTISAYCAYLICHAPELIADNIYEAQLLLQGVQRRVRQCLKDCRSEDDMYTKLSSFKPNKEDENEGIVAEGVGLSQLLTLKLPDEAERWGLLAKVWVMFLLSSVAPANNVAAHVKRLASGGEFITHLWAFMAQGGFVEQPWISCGDDNPQDCSIDSFACVRAFGNEAIDSIKKALSQALVLYYLLSGHIIPSGTTSDKFSIHCTGKGVDFVTASFDHGLQEAKIFDESTSTKSLLDELAIFYPDGSYGSFDDPLLSMQVTEFSRGGVVVGVTWNHVIADGARIAQFLVAVGELARGSPSPSIIPTRSDEAVSSIPGLLPGPIRHATLMRPDTTDMTSLSLSTSPSLRP
ncbi:hypothetical protein HU200_003389 [Digitaria exilis]|uniref:DUF4220 domain-containing protein n=1 Tax=Digitaria exilis TaxID=1010633 RepID=A0A835KTA1_9POAL|nr:hypothetical protein HU200_003389 [Digitaria exilis]